MIYTYFRLKVNCYLTSNFRFSAPLRSLITNHIDIYSGLTSFKRSNELFASLICNKISIVFRYLLKTVGTNYLCQMKALLKVNAFALHVFMKYFRGKRYSKENHEK